MPNFVEIAQTAAEIRRFFDFLRSRPSAILDFQKFKISTSGFIRSPNMRHRTKFREDRSNRSGDIAISDFGNFKFLTVGTLKRVELRLRAKFCRNRLNRGWDMAIFRFFKIAAVRHLGLVLRVLGPPTKSIWWSLTVQNLVVIGAVISTVCKFYYFAR